MLETVWLYGGFLLGLLIIIKGGDFFVDAAVWIAKVFGIPTFVIGATIVSLATTLPEIVTSIIATMNGNTEYAAGALDSAASFYAIATTNAIGSVTANTAMILSIGVLFIPMAIRRKDFLGKGLLLVSAVAILWLAPLSSGGKVPVYAGILLFLIFALFIADNLRSASRGKSDQTEKAERPATDKKTVTVNIVKFILGTAGIVLGSVLLVDNGKAIAESWGISAEIIGITLIAIGTSLPELITTITAISKKESGLSVGNIIGANIIDTALIVPICSLISGGRLIVQPGVLMPDLPICFLCTLIAILPALIFKKFSKWQGAAGLLVYAVYLVLRVVALV